MENWKDIKGYEGSYQVSDLGRVKSLKLNREKILSNRISGRYYSVNICKNKKVENKYIHILVAESFLNYIKKSRSVVIDHIDNDRFNNNLENLQVITQRENINKDCNGSSKLYGVRKGYKDKWYSQLRVKNKITHLGSFDTEERASIAYNLALTQLDKLEEYNLTK